jgi:hypothetical protein
MGRRTILPQPPPVTQLKSEEPKSGEHSFHAVFESESHGGTNSSYDLLMQQSLPADRRKAPSSVRSVILENLDPSDEEGMQYRMIGYRCYLMSSTADSRITPVPQSMPSGSGKPGRNRKEIEHG